jgi:hypothetical protein
MRNLVMAGSAGLFLTLGAAGASAQTHYQGERQMTPERMIEGRSAFVAPHHPRSIRLPGNDFGPGFNAPTDPSKRAASPADVAGGSDRMK